MFKGIWDGIMAVGSGALFIALLVGFFALLFVVVPWLIGWAFHYLLHYIRNEPEITGFWIRWFTGVAVGFIGYCFKSDLTVKKD